MKGLEYVRSNPMVRKGLIAGGAAALVYALLQLASVVRGGPVVGEIRLSRPYVNIVRRPDGSYNFTDFIDEFKKIPARKSEPLKYSINNIQMVDGSIDFNDGPKKTRHAVRGIQVAVPFLSNLRYYADRYVQPSFAARTSTFRTTSNTFHCIWNTRFPPLSLT